jgi:hypothetical protein
LAGQGVGVLKQGKGNNRHGATTRTIGLTSEQWENLIRGIEAVKPSAEIPLENDGGLSRFVHDMLRAVQLKKLSPSQPATMMAIIATLEAHSQGDVFSPAEREIMDGAVNTGAEVINLALDTLEWTDSAFSTQATPERVEGYSVEQLGQIMEDARTDMRYTPHLTPAVQFAQAVKWDKATSTENALLTARQQATTWLRNKPVNTDVHSLQAQQVGSRFAEILLEGMQADIQVARSDGSGRWTDHLTHFFAVTSRASHHIRSLTDWIHDMASAAKPFRNLAEQRHRHKDHRRPQRGGMLFGGMEEAEQQEEPGEDDESHAADMAAAIQHVRVHSMTTSAPRDGASCEFCGGRHDKLSCFLWLSEDPLHRIPLYFRVLRTSRKLAEQACQQGVSMDTITCGFCPPLGTMIEGSRSRSQKEMGPNDGGRDNTLRWTQLHVDDTVKLWQQGGWKPIPKCNNPTCIVRDKQGELWDWAVARKTGKHGHCQAVAEMNERLNQQATVATGAGGSGPLRRATMQQINFLGNMTPSEDNARALGSLLMARDSMDAPCRDDPPASQ